ncbi:MAG: tRNA preQ1(34) S-adenosylmethionine ribosyltransferase-isomerase QueA [Puniceicoccales bacterium]|jgi:S-adenosylmethionine:tRNA ribosyltransferase-isomerase|nr:tRNA preQ1(34) S-adenosylmethionine ribosyltransferase-isomerase QueA [Puniceicoccales bacterium]
MDTALFDYDLPEKCIAHTPAARRDASRLLVVERQTQKVTHHLFHELPDLLPAGTALFRNNARVLRARLPGIRPTGGHVECLLLRPAEQPDEWWCLLKPGKKAADGAGFGLPGIYQARATGQKGQEYRVQFTLPPGMTVPALAEKTGALPLPPYIERARSTADGVDYAALDSERYQTVYAEAGRSVAAAAPTAGLHFSKEVLAALTARGMPAHDLTLHVGTGTFQPVKTERIEDHPIHHEWYEIPAPTLAALTSTEAPRLAVGTTSLRAMEDFARKRAAGTATPDARGAYSGEAGLFIYPPAVFGGADLLLTNFHLPRSTLICLVAAFLTPGETDGIAWLKGLYAEAVAHGYRFYSYGDAMLIL